MLSFSKTLTLILAGNPKQTEVSFFNQPSNFHFVSIPTILTKKADWLFWLTYWQPNIMLS